MTDPRTYYRPWTCSPWGCANENPIAPLGAAGEPAGVVSPYAAAVALTPGLSHYWRFGKALSSAGMSSDPPFFANSSGATTLRSLGLTKPKLAPSILPGDPDDPSCDLNGGYLDAFDYRVFESTYEVQTAEIWVYYRSFTLDQGIMGEWAGGNGWMLYSSLGGHLRLYAMNAYLAANNALSLGLNHIVGVWGGTDWAAGGRNPDYLSRLYVNGVCVASGLTKPTNGNPNTLNARFQIGQYSNGQGTKSLDGLVDEPAVYSRMLQPEEISQHYELGT